MKLLRCNCVTSCMFIFVLLGALFVTIGISYYQKLRAEAPVIQKTSNNVSIKEYPIDESKPHKLRLIVISDTESDIETVKQFINISKLYSPDVVVHTGDITHLGVTQDMNDIKGLFLDYPFKIYFIPGDRDLWKSNGTRIFNEVFGKDYRTLDINGLKFLLIDNADEYRGISNEQFSFIRSEIGSSDYVFMHNPIVFNDSLLGLMKKGMGQYSEAVDKQRLELVDLIQKSSAKATFAGDQHVYSLTDDPVRPSLLHVVVATLSADRNIKAPSFVLYDFYDDGSFGIEEIPLVD